MSNKILETLKKILIYQFHYVYVFRKSNNILSRRRPTEAVRKAYFPAAELLDGKEEHKWLNILHKNHRRPHKGSRIRLEVHFFDGIIGLKGLQVRSFQVSLAHSFVKEVLAELHFTKMLMSLIIFFPKIPLARGKHYEPHRCRENISDAISIAKHLIYITCGEGPKHAKSRRRHDLRRATKEKRQRRC